MRVAADLIHQVSAECADKQRANRVKIRIFVRSDDPPVWTQSDDRRLSSHTPATGN